MKILTAVKGEGAYYSKEYPEDVKTIRETLARAGYAVSDEDAATAYHNWSEDEYCAGWHDLGWPDDVLVAGCLRYLRFTSDEADTAIARAEKAEAAQDALGIQLAAQSERLRLALAVVDAARHLTNMVDRVLGPCDLGGSRVTVENALAALDAVPGDALKGIGPALDRAHEASGVVTNGVKGVE